MLHFAVTFLEAPTSYKKPNLPMELPESIIDRLQHGEKHLFGQLIELYQDRVYGLALQLMKNEDDANEVAQKAFIKIYQKVKQFKGNSKFSVWMYRIIYNEAMTELKSKKKWVFDQEKNQETAQPRVFDTLHQEEQRNQIQWALEQLKSSERLALSLFYLEELSYYEITEITQWSLANVKIQLHRSKKKMKQLLSAYQFAQNL